MKNKYKHKIDLADLALKNLPRDAFRDALESIEYRGYRVESIKDGREIVITKPGGKRAKFGQPKREDFMVWVHNPKEESLWLITHNQILDDLRAKAEEDAKVAAELIDALEEVFNGSEPDDVLKGRKFNFKMGELPEVLLKAYKWIWGQEDCNYPNGDGRNMCMPEIRDLRKRIG